MARGLFTLKVRHDAYFMLVDTPVFAYEPVLKGLKMLKGLPFDEALVNPSSANLEYDPGGELQALITKLRSLSMDENGTMELERGGVKLDKSQRDSVVNALSQSVSIIQGPPGMFPPSFEKLMRVRISLTFG